MIGEIFEKYGYQKVKSIWKPELIFIIIKNLVNFCYKTHRLDYWGLEKNNLDRYD